MIEALKIYDPDRECPKCGNQEVRVQHRKGDEEDAISPVQHMERSCLRCGYQWAELPLDSPVEVITDDGD
jgi:DNA-directed RNA polymerase subunit M/transcription elongation factor TFIIS